MEASTLFPAEGNSREEKREKIAHLSRKELDRCGKPFIMMSSWLPNPMKMYSLPLDQ